MRLFINENIPIRKRLTKVEKAELRAFSIWHNNKNIHVQKCTVPEDIMQDLIDTIQAVAKRPQIVRWWSGRLDIGD